MAKLHGLLVVDKPGGMTSRDVVDRVQAVLPKADGPTRIGHMGTLDPLATGVLVLGIGEGTRFTELVQDMEKVYLAGVQLGVQSDTDDADGVVTLVAGATAPSQEAIAAELARWIGEVDQVPPDYSAVKVSGRRAYEVSRQGGKPALAARKTSIYGVDLRFYAYPHLELEIRCGKGTYIRALARDLGKAFGCGALIASLRRLRIGPFTPEQAVSLDANFDEIRQKLLPVTLAVNELPARRVNAEQARRLRQGQPIPREHLQAGKHAVFTEDGTLIGIAEADAKLLRPVRIFHLE